MRKIYPPFNKFAGFLLYCLLSIAVITLAQKEESLGLPCMPKPMTSNPARVTIGYVQLFTNPNPNPKWEFYDYINVIAYPKEGKYHFLRQAADPDAAKQLLAIKSLVENKKAKTKILLSIRNYDPSLWPDNEDGYGPIIKQTTDTIQEFNLDGVDFEYPGMRGSLCQKAPDGPVGPGGGPKLWDKGKDPVFAKFIGELKNEMDKIKERTLTLMLTVGSDTINGLDFENIDFLNIETYHNSIYQNIKSLNFQPPPGTPPSINSYPNSPLNAFDAAYKNWAKTPGIGKGQIIMGVDFGNTFQVVYNQDIATKQQVGFTPQNNDNFRQDPVLEKLKKIDSICPEYNPIDDKLFLYSFPWNVLSTSILNQNQCNSTKDASWVPKFDEGDGSYTPWLYKAKDPDDYQYISYEDYFSLNKKLEYANSNSIGGMSIRDISDDDSSNSLMNFMQVIRGKEPPSNSGGGKAGPATQGEVPSTSNPTDPTNSASMSPPPSNIRTGAIIGGVFGSLIGLAILGACGFYIHRNRDLPKSSSLRSLLKFNKGFPNSRNHAISRNPEMTSEPTLAPPTTVIPVASGYVTAMFDFTGKEENDLSFKKGDKIEVLERGDGPNDWWVGRVNGAVGEFPGNYVKET